MVDRMGSEEKESELQERILESPSLLPGFDGPVAAAKEVPVRRAGSADVVVVNAEGLIAIVECKRAVNPELRRWVIGQRSSTRLDFGSSTTRTWNVSSRRVARH